MQDIRSRSLILDLQECLPPSEQADDAEGGVVDWVRLNRRVAPANPKGYRSGSGRGLNLEGGLREARIGYELRFGVVKAQPGKRDSGRDVQMAWERPQHLADGALKEDHGFRDSIRLGKARRSAHAAPARYRIGGAEPYAREPVFARRGEEAERSHGPRRQLHAAWTRSRRLEQAGFNGLVGERAERQRDDVDAGSEERGAVRAKARGRGALRRDPQVTLEELMNACADPGGAEERGVALLGSDKYGRKIRRLGVAREASG